LQEGKAQFSMMVLNPTKDFTDALRLLMGQSGWSDGLNDCLLLCLKDVFPTGKSGFQSLEGSISIQVIGILGENGLDKDIERTVRLSIRRDPILSFQNLENLSYFSS